VKKASEMWYKIHLATGVRRLEFFLLRRSHAQTIFFQVIQLISSAKFFSAEEVDRDLSFNSETDERPQISKPSFWKRDRENVFLQMF